MTAMPGPAAPDGLTDPDDILIELLSEPPPDDPYPLYAQLRDRAPFLPIRFPGMPAGYLATTFASCSRLLREPATDGRLAGFVPPVAGVILTLANAWSAHSKTNPSARTQTKDLAFMMPISFVQCITRRITAKVSGG